MRCAVMVTTFSLSSLCVAGSQIRLATTDFIVNQCVIGLWGRYELQPIIITTTQPLNPLLPRFYLATGSYLGFRGDDRGSTADDINLLLGVYLTASGNSNLVFETGLFIIAADVSLGSSAIASLVIEGSSPLKIASDSRCRIISGGSAGTIAIHLYGGLILTDYTSQLLVADGSIYLHKDSYISGDNSEVTIANSTWNGHVRYFVMSDGSVIEGIWLRVNYGIFQIGDANSSNQNVWINGTLEVNQWIGDVAIEGVNNTMIIGEMGRWITTDAILITLHPNVVCYGKISPGDGSSIVPPSGSSVTIINRGIIAVPTYSGAIFGRGQSADCIGSYFGNTSDSCDPVLIINEGVIDIGYPSTLNLVGWSSINQSLTGAQIHLYVDGGLSGCSKLMVGGDMTGFAVLDVDKQIVVTVTPWTGSGFQCNDMVVSLLSPIGVGYLPKIIDPLWGVFSTFIASDAGGPFSPGGQRVSPSFDGTTCKCFTFCFLFFVLF
jgi:hypothetical protein